MERQQPGGAVRDLLQTDGRIHLHSNLSIRWARKIVFLREQACKRLKSVEQSQACCVSCMQRRCRARMWVNHKLDLCSNTSSLRPWHVSPVVWYRRLVPKMVLSPSTENSAKILPLHATLFFYCFTLMSLTFCHWHHCKRGGKFSLSRKPSSLPPLSPSVSLAGLLNLGDCVQMCLERGRSLCPWRTCGPVVFTLALFQAVSHTACWRLSLLDDNARPSQP